MLQSDRQMTEQDRKEVMGYAQLLKQKKQQEKNLFAWQRMQHLLFSKDANFFEAVRAELEKRNFYAGKHRRKKEKRRKRTGIRGVSLP